MAASAFRFAAGCRARFDDTRYLKPGTFLDTHNTAEYMNYQSKTAGRSKKRKYIPLICPKIDFAQIYQGMTNTDNTADLDKYGPPKITEADGWKPWWNTFMDTQGYRDPEPRLPHPYTG